MLRAGPVGVLLSGRRLRGAVIALSFDQLVAWGVLYYAYAVLSAPIAVDLAISRTAVAAAFSGCLLIAGWTARAIGPVLDERGTATLMRAGAVAAPLAFAALAVVDGIGGLVLVFAALGAVHAVTLYEPAFRTLVDWCPVERQRARMTLLLTSVGGLASTAFLPLTGWLVDQHAWRTAVLLLAALLAAVLIPIRFSLPLPQRRNHAAPPARLAAAPTSARLLSIGLSLHALASTGAFISLMWFLVERGETRALAAAIAGLAGAAQVPGRLVAGPLRRALGDRSILAVLLSIQSAALLGAVALDGPASIALIMVFGAASGMMTLERTTVLVDWYGRSSFGAHQGRLTAATSTARAAAPFLVEAAHHVLSYRATFACLGAVLTCGVWACAAAARAHAAVRAADFTAKLAPSGPAS